MQSEVEKVVFSALELQEKINEIAKNINAVNNNDLVLIGILKGSYMFMSDLSRALSQIGCPHQIDFMSVSSYSDTASTGNIKIECDLRHSITNKHIIVVEDIVDTGRTLSKLIDLLNSRKPASLRVCTLLSKPTERVVDVNVDFLGFELNPPEFVIGYGLDYNEKFRDLPFIGVPTKEAIEKYKTN